MADNEVLPSNELRRIRSAWPGGGWTWDSRSGSVASSFSALEGADYEAILVEVFPNRWDGRTISRAPSAVQVAAANSGGIREGQLLYSAPNSPPLFAYALWWPWGDDATVSVRVALSSDSMSAQATLRELFGVEL